MHSVGYGINTEVPIDWLIFFRPGMDELQTLELSITELEEAAADATAGAIEAEDPQYM